MESKYQQGIKGKERDDIVKDWYNELPVDERNAIDRTMRKLSNGLKHIDIIGMLELLIALDCSGQTSYLIGGKGG